MNKYKRVIFELLPFLLVWALLFAFGLWLRRQIPIDVRPGELHGFDYNGHGVLFSDIRHITFTRFRHPLFGWLMSPIPLMGGSLAKANFLVYWGYLSFVFSGLVTLGLWMIYRIARRIEGVGSVRALICTLLFAGFGYVRYLAAGPESFSVSMLLSLVVLWWGVKAPFFRESPPNDLSVKYDKIVWGVLFFLASGITITQGAKVFLAYLMSRRLSKRDWACIAFGAVSIVFLGVMFYIVKLVVLGSGGRTIASAFTELFSCIPEGMTWAQRFRMLEMFFFEPIIPHGVPYSVSKITTGYSSWWQYALCAFVYLWALVGIWRLRRTVLSRMIGAMFCVDIAIHLVMFWGMEEAQIYCGHWFYVLPILMAGGLRRSGCENDSKGN